MNIDICLQSITNCTQRLISLSSSRLKSRDAAELSSREASLGLVEAELVADSENDWMTSESASPNAAVLAEEPRMLPCAYLAPTLTTAVGMTPVCCPTTESECGAYCGR
mmetsp:Transcript_512/g.919  ORF Transcript_512/g.919 Transcript_512/m.919 type:complete len:109 (-) Transcript_512:188-514(-)